MFQAMKQANGGVPSQERFLVRSRQSFDAKSNTGEAMCADQCSHYNVVSSR